MGCKQCRIFLTRHPEHEQKSMSIPNNHEQLNKPSLNVRKRHRKLKYLTTDFPTLDNLPVELIYCIFDQLDTYTILTSLYNVSHHLNSVICSYDQYDLNLKSISLSDFHHICSIIRPEQIISLTLSDGNTNVGLVQLFLKKFRIESFKYLRSLRLINIDDNEQMIKIFLLITDRLQRLSIENSNEIYNDTLMDILTTSIGKQSLCKLSLDIEKNRILNPTIIWSEECFLQEIKLVGLCDLSLFRSILFCSPNLKKFQAYDIDLDDEWTDHDDDDDENEGNEIRQRHMLPRSYP